jgi:hypothetical protein
MKIWPILLWFSGYYGGKEIKDVGIIKYQQFLMLYTSGLEKRKNAVEQQQTRYMQQ